ncbi:helix-turn-helix domain-containing protein [Pseudomonas sp. HK3]
MPNTLSIRSYSSKPTTHSHCFNQLVLPLKGSIDITVGTFNGNVSLRECVIIKSHQNHLFKADTQARFVVADMDKLPPNIASSEQVVFAINASLIHYLTFIENQLEHQINNKLEKSMFDTFYLLLEEQSLRPKVDARIGRSIHYIEQNMPESIQVKTLASLACLSETQFKKLFKVQTGLTAMQYVTKLRMEKAQALLRHTDYPLQMIAEKVGYAYISAFSRKFSQYFGLSPSRFSK